MAKPKFIELPGCEPIPILYEDRSVLAIDKARGWMLVPHSWRQTNWNLQAAIDSSIRADDFWAKSRNLKFLRHIHRLDADTSGILLFAKSMGALEVMSELFEDRRMEKTYLAVVEGAPKEAEWTCELPLGPDEKQFGRMKVDFEAGKASATYFKVLQKKERFTLIEARPVTGRTHQIRVHLAESGTPIFCDELYGRVEKGYRLGLRAVRLAYQDSFTRRRVEIRAPFERFMAEYGFTPSLAQREEKRAVPKHRPEGTHPPQGGKRGD